MARPKADMRQKTLLPTVFSNARIGKLGKTRPWIFQSWAGLLSRSDAYGIFKWEPDRIAVLTWPYNPERQEVFAEDMELLAEGSAEDRVIQKYEVEGIAYGRFPNWEEHNALQSRGIPTLPFPPGVAAPCPPEPPNPKKKTEYEIERNYRLTEVNSGLTEVNPQAPPVQPTSTQETRPASRHLYPCKCGGATATKPCPYCEKERESSRAASTATPAPKPNKTLGFDPHTINEPMCGYSVEQIQKIVRYHWDESENAFWRDKTQTREFFERNLDKMARAIPSSWLNPKKVGKKSFMHPKPGLRR